MAENSLEVVWSFGTFETKTSPKEEELQDGKRWQQSIFDVFDCLNIIT